MVAREAEGVPQAWLTAKLFALTEQLRAGLPQLRLAELEFRDMGEQLVGGSWGACGTGMRVLKRHLGGRNSCACAHLGRPDAPPSARDGR